MTGTSTAPLPSTRPVTVCVTVPEVIVTDEVTLGSDESITVVVLGVSTFVPSNSPGSVSVLVYEVVVIVIVKVVVETGS